VTRWRPDVPDDLHAGLIEQAREQGMSLNQFLLAEYARIHRRGQNKHLLAAMADVPGPRPTREQLVAQVRLDRDRRA
jgi:hypothetical protein